MSVRILSEHRSRIRHSGYDFEIIDVNYGTWKKEIIERYGFYGTVTLFRLYGADPGEESPNPYLQEIFAAGISGCR